MRLAQQGNLFIAVGDNTNPHNPGYYNSIDEREGRAYWDAQRTSGNAQDLRGKILRIKPGEEGGYSIPEGNLFSSDGSKGRPEIYVMGCRNPYRIGVDQKNGTVFWGDVGQNTIDNPERGPISYDEFNKATGPGFFGWPYFAGDNRAYADFDFETEEIGPFFDPDAPVNDSPNNTGTHHLPPAQPALIWYSYGESEEFQHLKTGGKSPIGGPTYYSDLYPVLYDASDLAPWLAEYVAAGHTLAFPNRSFPSSFDGTLFIAEWMRDWVNVVSFDKAGNLHSIDSFMPEEEFSHPIELEFGPDGALYMLEYGPFWFAQHPEAKLVRIEYVRGNRPPIARMSADKAVGAAPLSVQFSAHQSYDLDENDQLAYSWQFGDIGSSKNVEPTFTFDKPGIYSVTLTLEDSHGAVTTVTEKIQVGNEPPQIELHVDGNQSFFWENLPIRYNVSVEDLEDGSLEAGEIATEDVVVTAGATSMNPDMTMLEQEHANTVDTYMPKGMTLIANSDCQACHAVDQVSVGPSYKDIAERYQADNDAIELLVTKIIEGGSGNWGDRIMSAHPQLSREDVSEMVQYILGLGDEVEGERMATAGEIMPASTDDYIFTISYRDKGGEEVGPQTARASYVLRHARLDAVESDGYEMASKFNSEVVRFLSDGGYLVFEAVDLTNINSITTLMSLYQVSAALEVRAGGIDGRVLGKVNMQPTYTGDRAVGATVGGDNSTEFTIPLEASTGMHDIYIVFKVDEGHTYPASTAIMEWVQFDR